MLLLVKLAVWTVCLLPRSRRALVLENLALRQQLATVVHNGRRPRLIQADRLFWVVLRDLWPDWISALAIVKPATVVAWHRRAFRGYWRRLSRKQGRPPVDVRLRELIELMAKENRWGAPRIHGELLKLGLRVSERTVSRYLRSIRPRRPAGTSWTTFLDNHREVLAAMDFFIVPTVTFRLLYALLVIQHDRRRVLHMNITAHPTAGWVVQQLREAFPSLPKIPSSLKYQAFLVIERCARIGRGSLRRDCLDHIVAINEHQLLRVVRSYVAYYNRTRTHLALGKDPPEPRAVDRPSGGPLVAVPEVGGLHHRYGWRKAA